MGGCSREGTAGGAGGGDVVGGCAAGAGIAGEENLPVGLCRGRPLASVMMPATAEQSD